METFISELRSLFGWVVSSTIQVSILVCLILVIKILLREKLSVRWHYWLWVILLVRMVMPWAPESSLSVFTLLSRAKDAVVSQSYSNEITEIKETSVKQEAGTTGTVEADTRPSRGMTGTGVSSLEVIEFLAIVWFAGAIVLGAAALWCNYRLWRIIKTRRLVTEGRILDLFEDCKTEMGIGTVVGMVVTDRIKSPALFGVIRPRLLLPEGTIESLSREELRYVFLHELAHLKRRDIYLGWVMVILQVMHWFNPLVWFAFARMRAERELACDGLVLATTGTESCAAYGQTLLNLFKGFSGIGYVPGIAGILENKGQLKRRITMITKFKNGSYRWSAGAVVLLAILGIAGLTNAIDKNGKPIDIKIAEFKLNYSGANHEGGLTVSIKNDNDAAIPKMRLRFYRGEPDANLDVKGNLQGGWHEAGPIEPGKEWNECTGSFPLSDGQYIFNVVLDYDNGIKESDENNNRATLNVTIKNSRIAEMAVSYSGDDEQQERYTDKLKKNVTVDIDKCPDGERLTVQYAVIAICEKAGIPYQWEKSAQSAYPERTQFIEPIHIKDVSAKKALLDVLNPVGLKFVIDENGLYLSHGKNTSNGDAQTIATGRRDMRRGLAPVVVSTSPAAYANNVDPNLKEITVTFSQPMMDGSWSWTGGGETYPQTTGQIHYDESKKICTMPVKLLPGKVYWVGINSPSHQNFKTEDRVPAKRYVILFATKNEQGQPTTIPADMRRKATQINGTQGKRREPVEVNNKEAGREDKMASENLVSEGWQLWQQRKLTEAEEKFNEAVEKNPQSDKAYQGLGWSQLNQGKKENAKDSFEKCVAINPKNSAALNGLGWIAKGQGDNDEAIKWWEKAVEASNGNATASLSGLTQVYMEKKEYDNAIKYYQMWLKVEPNNADAKTGLEKAEAAVKSK